ncbi:MAG: hypothetical protein APF84_15300 [Gracilibacter sp. BRH_c7a]|nr:MAG: hypothetical protein APF84_15300 [Gracilibacter sp. BRH_c7a]
MADLYKILYEYIFGLFVVAFWHGLLGISFAFFLKLINGKNLLFKGWAYGIGIWFFSYVITTLYQVPELLEISLHTSVSNIIGATLHGVSLGYVFIYLQRKKRIWVFLNPMNNRLFMQYEKAILMKSIVSRQQALYTRIRRYLHS